MSCSAARARISRTRCCSPSERRPSSDATSSSPVLSHSSSRRSATAPAITVARSAACRTCTGRGSRPISAKRTIPRANRRSASASSHQSSAAPTARSPPPPAAPVPPSSSSPPPSSSPSSSGMRSRHASAFAHATSAVLEAESAFSRATRSTSRTQRESEKPPRAAARSISTCIASRARSKQAASSSASRNVSVTRSSARKSNAQRVTPPCGFCADGAPRRSSCSRRHPRSSRAPCRTCARHIPRTTPMHASSSRPTTARANHAIGRAAPCRSIASLAARCRSSSSARSCSASNAAGSTSRPRRAVRVGSDA